jgi:mono/diheme cytochrome c family protein
MSDAPHKPKLPPIPRWIIMAVIVVPIATFMAPIAMIARARTTPSHLPRIHIIQDMDAQPKFKAQAQSDLFADHRASRPQVPGTVARGELFDDDHYHRGFETDGNLKPVTAQFVRGTSTVTENKWKEGYPAQVAVNKELLDRGRDRYNIYCGICHGPAGYGDGMVHQRAAQPEVSVGWVPPVNLHAVDPGSGKPMYGEDFNPNGKLFNTISRGARTMPGYAKQLSVDDRWAIVAYVRALQLSQSFPVDRLPADLKSRLQAAADPATLPSTAGAR